MKAKTIGTAAAMLSFAGILSLAAGVPEPAEPDPRAQSLLEKYQAIRSSLTNSVFGAPICVESTDANSSLRGDVYGIIDTGFADVRKCLADPREWSEIGCLHPNVKAVVLAPTDLEPRLTFYVGDKEYQKPEKARRVDYAFKLECQGAAYVRGYMSSPDGPEGTRDHLMSFEAMPLSETGTFFHLVYSCGIGLAARAGIAGYLATVGRGHIGFTVVGREADGSPVFIQGRQGIVERNAMRYYLAVLAQIATREIPAGQRFDRRLDCWYTLSDRYRKQIFEVEREDYIRNKHKEREDRLRLQHEADAARPAGGRGDASPPPET